MMLRKIVTKNDEYAFLRGRAAELIDKGDIEGARQLLNAIDLVQIQCIASALKKQNASKPAKEAE